MSEVTDSIKDFFVKSLIMCEKEVRKISHDRTELWIRAVQPALWLIIFGSVFTKYNIIQTGSYSYMAYLMPGILAQSILFVAIFYGITIVWDRDLGVLCKLLVVPMPSICGCIWQSAFSQCTWVLSSSYCNNHWYSLRSANYYQSTLLALSNSNSNTCIDIFCSIVNFGGSGNENSGAIHGNWSSYNHADVLCE